MPHTSTAPALKPYEFHVGSKRTHGFEDKTQLLTTWKSSSGSHKLSAKARAIFPVSSSAGGILGSSCHDFFTTLWLSNAAQQTPYETFIRQQCAAAVPWPARHFSRSTPCHEHERSLHRSPRRRELLGLPGRTQLPLSAEILSNCNHIMSMQHHSQWLSAKE